MWPMPHDKSPWIRRGSPNSRRGVPKRISFSKPPALRPKRPTVSPGTEAAILTALQKLPADRWGSAKEFGDALAGTTTQRSGAVPTVVLPAAGARAQRRRGAGVLAWAGWIIAGVASALAAWARFWVCPWLS